MHLCQWGVQCILCGRKSWLPPQGKGMFVVLPPDCIMTALVIEIWIGLGPKRLEAYTFSHYISGSQQPSQKKCAACACFNPVAQKAG